MVKFYSKVNVLNWTWPTGPVMFGYKKNTMTQQKDRLRGVCYQLLCTNLADETLCTLLLDHNIHGCLSATENVCFKAKKCVRNAFSCKL